MSNIYSYSPTDVLFTVGGYIVTGWDSISIARGTDGFQTIKGIRGKNTRVRNLDTSANITIRIIQTSPSNDVFSTIHDQDLSRGTGRLSLTLKDTTGQSVFDSAEAWIVSYPAVVFSGDFEYREWRIFCQSTGNYSVSGNSNPGNSPFSSIISGAKDFVSNIF
jgi:hypothetical protein